MITPNNTIKQKEQVKSWSEAGVKKMRSIQKRIICVDTGEVFNSSHECATKMNIDRSTLCRVVKGKANHLIKGKRYKYYDE